MTSEKSAHNPIPPPGNANGISNDRIDFLVECGAADAAMHGSPLTAAEQADVRSMILDRLGDVPFPPHQKGSGI